ncbi:MAG: 23S rRNA (uracil(1939)-C(5))-methyltransferase RlmD [Succinivibrio sp.]|nr:23S rRNA (uracil(1939)-C(5))-methyltransferase RlmD [Succinivibrio sp.]
MVSFYQEKPKQLPPAVEGVCSGLDLTGRGIVQLKAGVYFAPGLLPGERARVQVKNERQHELRVLKLLQQSPQRRSLEDWCSRCGGCPLRHAPPELILEAKTAGLKRLFERSWGVKLPPPAQVAASVTDGYRRACRLALRVDRGVLKLGLRAPLSHEIVSLEHCPVLTDRLNSLLPSLRSLLETLPSRHRLGHVDLLDSDGAPAVSLHFASQPQTDDLSRLKAWGEREQVAVFCSEVAALGSGDLQALTPSLRCFVCCAGREVACTPEDFVQVNAAVNEELVKWVIQCCQPQAGQLIWDLYSGLGNFAFALHEHGATVKAVELLEAMVVQGNETARRLGLEGIAFYRDDLDKDFSEAAWAQQCGDLALLDPGRKGAANAFTALLRLKVPRIVLVSCNPQAAAADLKELLGRKGYEIINWAVFDMFPGTTHVETVCLLTHRG